MTSALNRLPNGNIELTITVSWSQIKQTYDQTLEKLAKDITIDGFRKGKAPQKLVTEKVDKGKLYEETLKLLLPDIWAQNVKEHNLKPIVSPQLRVISAAENKDWQVVGLTCELPDIKLGSYQDAIRKASATDKIWVPGKDKKVDQDKKLAQIFKTLNETCQLTVPEMLIQDEINRMLSRLIDQTGKLGLTVEEYLKSQNKTVNQIKLEYQKQAEEMIRLELILGVIADADKVEVTDGEIDQLIAATADEKIKKELDTPEQKLFLKHLLRKRKVIDSLTAL